MPPLLAIFVVGRKHCSMQMAKRKVADTFFLMAEMFYGNIEGKPFSPINDMKG